MTALHARLCEYLIGWSGPYVADTGEEFFFCETLQASSWANPRLGCQFELEALAGIVYRGVEHLFLTAEQRKRPVGDEELEARLKGLRLPQVVESSPLASERVCESARYFYSARSVQDTWRDDRDPAPPEGSPQVGPRFAFHLSE